MKYCQKHANALYVYPHLNLVEFELTKEIVLKQQVLAARMGPAI